MMLSCYRKCWNLQVVDCMCPVTSFHISMHSLMWRERHTGSERSNSGIQLRNVKVGSSPIVETKDRFGFWQRKHFPTMAWSQPTEEKGCLTRQWLSYLHIEDTVHIHYIHVNEDAYLHMHFSSTSMHTAIYSEIQAMTSHLRTDFFNPKN